jgi:WD40 repeat protein
MRILLPLLLLGICLGCGEPTTSPTATTPQDAAATSQIARAPAGEIAPPSEPDGAPDLAESPSDALNDEVVLEALQGPDPVAVAIVKEPIYRYAAKTVAFSPDGTWLAVGYGHGMVGLWNLEQKQFVREWPAHNNWTFDLWFSTDSQSLWTGGGDNRVRRWNVSTGKVEERFEDHTDDIHGIAVTRDGRQLISGADDQLVVIRDLMAGETLALEGHSRQVTAIALSPQQTQFASASRDDTARLWDLESGELLYELRGHTGHVMCVDFSHDGTRLLTGSNDGTIRVWSTTTGELKQTIEPAGKAVFTAVWLPGDGVIASGTADGLLRLIRVEDGEVITSQDLQSNVADVAVSPDGETLAAAVSEGNVHLLATDGETLVPSLVIPPVSLPGKIGKEAE